MITVSSLISFIGSLKRLNFRKTIGDKLMTNLAKTYLVNRTSSKNIGGVEGKNVFRYMMTKC